MKDTLLQLSGVLELDELLPLLRGYIVEHLQEEHTDPNSSVKDSLAWLEVGDSYVMDLDWFQNGMPQALKMANVVETYHLLHKTQQ